MNVYRVKTKTGTYIEGVFSQQELCKGIVWNPDTCKVCGKQVGWDLIAGWKRTYNEPDY